MSKKELLKIYQKRGEFFFIGICVIIPICLMGIGSNQFSLLFPEGQYRYAATGFFVGEVLTCALIFYRPIAALCLLLLILPLGVRLAEFFKIELGELIFTVDVIAIWLVALIFIFIHRLRRDRLLVYFSVFFLILIVSSFEKFNIDSIGIVLNGVITPFAVYILTQGIVKKFRDFKAIASVLALIAIACSLFAFVQPIINDHLTDFLYLRLVSVFYNPIIFANVLLLLWPFILIVEPFERNSFEKLSIALKSIGILISLTALVFAGSRGSDIICGFQIMWILAKNYSTKTNAFQRYPLQFLVAAIVIVFLMAFYSEFLTETVFRRFFQSNSFEEGSSASERILGAMGAVELGFSNLLLGVGLGEFKNAYLTTHAASIGELNLESAHNFILNLFAEAGVFALALWLLIIYCINKRLGIVDICFEAWNNLLAYRVLQASFFGYTASQFLFYGEFLHKNVGLPMVLYFVIFGLISAVYFMRR